MPAGIMIPAAHFPSNMMGRSNGAGFGSTSDLTLSQHHLMEGQQQQHAHRNHVMEQLINSDSSIARLPDDDFDTKSCSENIDGVFGDDQNPNQRPNKKKRYHRHTQHQIEEMEAFFKECPHPDDKQRNQLGRELGLEPLQIKFWFQNKRTQKKTQHERHDNSQLRAQNEKLRIENIRYKEAMSNASCPNCGGPAALGEMSFDEHHLRVENIRLKEEIDRISGMSSARYPPIIMSPQFGGRTSLDLEVGNIGMQGSLVNELFGCAGGDLLGNHVNDKAMIIELSVAAMDELLRMANLHEPLWVVGHNNSTDHHEILNQDEYFRSFPRGIGPKPVGFRSEASRDTGVVMMNHVHLVEMLLNVNQWSTVFSGIVSKAVTVEVLSTGVAGTYNGAMQVMSAEYQVPSPLVPTRESYFVRYCKLHPDGTWSVVDVSVDQLRPNLVPRCRRRPSGCLIQEMPNGYSKVTWVEHVEVDDRSVHEIYKAIVSSGNAFGAKRWVATLDRQCERLATVISSNINQSGVIPSEEGRKSMLKLAERMVVSFCNGVSASTTHQWTTLSGTGADDVRVMTRKSIDDPGRPPGIVLSTATSFWLPVPPHRVFEFLRDENSRSVWDILSNGSVVQEMAHITSGREQGNCVSLLRVNSGNSNQSNMLILQESCTDSSGSFVIYAPVDIVAMNVVLNGGDPNYVALLPSGFAILPDGSSTGNSGGSLLTVAFQILVDSVPTAKLSLGSVATVNSLISCTAERIKVAVTGDNSR